MTHKHLTHLFNQAATSGKLDLCHLQLTALPPKLFELKNLEWLYLDHNQLTTLPVELAELTSLRVLSVTHNQLTTLPPAFGQLQNLEWLYLAHNQLTTLPPDIAELRNLKALSLAHNPLTELPKRIVMLPYLKILSLENTALESPPVEILSQGTSATLTYLRKSLHGRKQWTTNLLLVGEPGVGKTALLRNLLDEPAPLSEEIMTGVTVKTWSLKPSSLAKVTLQLNTWDFGQPLSTIHYPLSTIHRAVYLLVFHAKWGYEVGKLYHWLTLIQATAPHSPVWLIATHLDEKTEVLLPWEDLKRKYPQLVGYHKLSNKTKQGLPELTQLMADTVMTLPWIGEVWPIHWLAAVNAMRAKPDYYLTIQQFQELMAEKNVTPKETIILAKWLHAIGDLLYFPDPHKLKNLVILQPHWVMNLLSRLLTSPVVSTNKGLLSVTLINELWGDLEPVLQEQVLNIMEHLNLAYRMSETQHTSVIVERLPLDPPEHVKSWTKMSKAKEISMTYSLNTFPSDIPSSFIVRTRRFSTNTHWHYGALLADRHHFGLLQAFPAENKLQLAVRGPYPHHFFAVLRDALELTLQRYPGLHIHRHLPCPGHYGQPCTYEFDYAALEKALTRNIQAIQCHETFEMMPVEELLFGLDKRSLEAVLQRIEILREENSKEVEMRSWVEWSQRQLFHQLTAAQSSATAVAALQCPYLFTLTPTEVNGWQKMLVMPEVKLQLYCQGTSSHLPHPMTKEDGGIYTISDWRRWNHLGPLAFWITNIAFTSSLGNGLDSPPILPEELTKLRRLQQDFPARIDETVLPSLCLLLKELDPSEQWGGLQRLVLPEGVVLWLCGCHAEEYRRKNR